MKINSQNAPHHPLPNWAFTQDQYLVNQMKIVEVPLDLLPIISRILRCLRRSSTRKTTGNTKITTTTTPDTISLLHMVVMRDIRILLGTSSTEKIHIAAKAIPQSSKSM